MSAPGIEPDPEFSDIRATYLQGRYLSAYELGQAQGIWSRPASPEREVFLARVLRAVGGTRQARYKVLCAWRRDRENDAARYWYAHELSSPVRALLFMDGEQEPQSAEPRQVWRLLKALNFAIVRDFERSSSHWKSAAEIREDPWMYTVKSHMLRIEGRYQESLEPCEQALLLQPRYSPAFRTKILILRTLGRDEEALELVQSSRGELESFELAAAEASLLHDRDDHRGALQALEQVPRLAPRLEREFAVGLAYQISYYASLAGRHAQASAIAASCLTPALERLHRRESPEGRRVRLAVPREMQRHNTCAPASLAALGAFWNRETMQDEIVEKICRDGTSGHSERKWAQEGGWVTREFQMSWTICQELIDRGMPFAFVTNGVSMGHMQVACGYDSSLGTLLVRDPSCLSLTEYVWDDLEEQERAFGARALLLLPKEQEHLLDALELPDAELFDIKFSLESALDRHDREAAAMALSKLETRAPEHLLTRASRRMLASYDGNPRALLDWADAMLEIAPENASLRLRKLQGMVGLAPVHERLEHAERFASETRAPEILAELAELLANTSGGHQRRQRLLWQVVGMSPGGAMVHRDLANALWASDRKASTLLYRVASCLAEYSEPLAWSYFLAARYTGQVDEAISFLEARARRLGAITPAPIGTLADAYGFQDRHAEAAAVLAHAREEHREDGPFLVRLGEQLLATGHLAQAEELAASISGRVPAIVRHRYLAKIAIARGEAQEAVEHLQEVTKDDPLDLGAQERLAEFQSASEGVEAAIARLRELADRFPFNEGLAHLLMRRLRQYDESAAEEYLLSFAERVPADASAQLQLASLESGRGKSEEAFARLDRLLGRGNASAGLYSCRGATHARRGEREEARKCYEMALALDADHIGALDALLGLAVTRKDAQEVLSGYYERILSQPAVDDGVIAFLERAEGLVAPSDLQEKLNTLVEKRPELWIGHFARTEFAVMRNELETALDLAQKVVERFPMVPGSWKLLGSVHGERGEGEQAIKAMERLVALAPSWSQGCRSLAEALTKAGDTARAQALLQKAVAIDPLDAVNRGYLADVLWKQGKSDQAIDSIRRALQISPNYRWAWTRLDRWTDRSSEIIDFARELAAKRGSQAGLWLSLAEILEHAPISEQLLCVEEAIATDPASIEAHDLRAELFGKLGNYQEALAACRPEYWGDSPPIPLRGRRASLLYDQGEKTAARDELLTALEAATDYSWGVNKLLEWARAEGDDEEFFEQACKVVEAAPHSAAAQAELAEAYRLREDYDKADDHLRLALKIAPRDAVSLMTLVDLRIDKNRLDEAEQALALIDEELIGSSYRRVRLACHRGREQEAISHFAAFLEHPLAGSEISLGLLRTVEAGLVNVSKLKSYLESELERGKANRLMGWVWWNTRGSGMFWFQIWRRLMGRFAACEGRTLVMQSYIENLADREKKITFALFRAFNGKALRASTKVWASVGYVLIQWDRYYRARRWLRDMRERPEVEGWMLWNAALAERFIGNIAAAAEIHRYALGLPDDEYSHDHRIQLAFWEAIDGDQATARELLDSARGKSLDDSAEFCRDCAEAMLRWRDSERTRGDYDDLGEALVRAKARLVLGQHPSCRKQYYWALRRVRSDISGIRGWRWWFNCVSS